MASNARLMDTLFFDVARIIEVKRPAAFVLENVKILKAMTKEILSE